MLDDFVATGDSFSEIIQRLWNHLSQHVKRRAIKHGDGWSEEAADQSAWEKVMQFKLNNHLVDNTKSDQAWNEWLSFISGETVKLLIFEYGVAISKAKDLDTFLSACIQPEQLDGAGATAECSLRVLLANWKCTGVQALTHRQLRGVCGRTISRGISIAPPGRSKLVISHPFISFTYCGFHVPRFSRGHRT
jgi:hypothetical protein